MTTQPKRQLHLCAYCFIGAVPELPARCPHCNAKLTLTVQPKVSPAEIVRRRREAEED